MIYFVEIPYVHSPTVSAYFAKKDFEEALRAEVNRSECAILEKDGTVKSTSGRIFATPFDYLVHDLKGWELFENHGEAIEWTKKTREGKAAAMLVEEIARWQKIRITHPKYISQWWTNSVPSEFDSIADAEDACWIDEDTQADFHLDGNHVIDQFGDVVGEIANP